MGETVAPATPSAKCARSRQLSRELWPLIACDAPDVPRYALVAAAACLAHEHHSSIVRLVETAHFATAAALVRPLVEAATTAAWALYVPQPAAVEGLFLNTDKLPKPSRMLSQLEARAELRGKLDLKRLMDGPGVMFHRFTHGDMDQLRRRFSTTGATFNERENTGTLLIADLMLLLAVTVYEVTTPSLVLKDFLRARTDGLIAEIRANAGLPVEEWKGWEPLPAPLVPAGDIPKELHK